jgi:hypothetical protein
MLSRRSAVVLDAGRLPFRSMPKKGERADSELQFPCTTSLASLRKLLKDIPCRTKSRGTRRRNVADRSRQSMLPDIIAENETGRRDPGVRSVCSLCLPADRSILCEFPIAPPVTGGIDLRHELCKGSTGPSPALS